MQITKELVVFGIEVLAVYALLCAAAIGLGKLLSLTVVEPFRSARKKHWAERAVKVFGVGPQTLSAEIIGKKFVCLASALDRERLYEKLSRQAASESADATFGPKALASAEETAKLNRIHRARLSILRSAEASHEKILDSFREACVVARHFGYPVSKNHADRLKTPKGEPNVRVPA